MEDEHNVRYQTGCPSIRDAPILAFGLRCRVRDQSSASSCSSLRILIVGCAWLESLNVRLIRRWTRRLGPRLPCLFRPPHRLHLLALILFRPSSFALFDLAWLILPLESDATTLLDHSMSERFEGTISRSHVSRLPSNGHRTSA